MQMKPAYEPVKADVEEVHVPDPSAGITRRKSLVFAGIGVGVLVSALFALFVQGSMFQGSFFNSPSSGSEKQGAGILFV